MTNKETIDVIKRRCDEASRMGFKLALEPFDGGFQWQWKHPNGMLGLVSSTSAATKQVALMLATLSIH